MTSCPSDEVRGDRRGPTPGLLIWAGGFSPARSLADAIGLLSTIEAGLIVLVLLAWMASS